MPAIHPTTARQRRGTPEITDRLAAIFESLPDRDLLVALKGPVRRGRPGYQPETLWRCFVTYYALGLESVSALVRLLRDNPYIADACGASGEMPSQPTLSRFGTKLAHKRFAVKVRDVMRALTNACYESLEGFGKSVAIDSTTIKAWSNGGKRGKKVKIGEVRRRRPRHPGQHSDPNAGWAVKTNTHGKNSYTFGYKVHILADTTYELPIVVDVTPGNFADVNKATALLAQARYSYSRFLPRYVICDAGYSSEKLRRTIRHQYKGIPVIDPNPQHLRAVAKTDKTEEWKEIYRRRTAIERLNGRLKAFYKLDSVRVRETKKVRVHAFLSAIVLLATAVTFPDTLRARVA